MPRLYAIGDIHGCFNMLRHLLQGIRDHEMARGGKIPRVVLLGDYIDRGPDSCSVLEFLSSPDTAREFEMIPLRGNHEGYILDLMQKPDDYARIRSWFRNGGRETVLSYGLDPDTLSVSMAPFFRRLPLRHYEYLAAMPLRYQWYGYYFVHAGIDPTLPLGEQTPHAMTQIREPFLSSVQNYGLTIVHGHTQTENWQVDIRPNRINVNTGAGAISGVLSALALRDDGAVQVLEVGRDNRLTVDTPS